MPVAATFQVQMQFSGSAGAWTDVTADVRLDPSLRASYGIRGAKPTDRVASTGTMTFALDNSQKNSAKLIGYYAPGHANARAGFEVGIGVRVAFTYSAVTYYKFRGSLDEIGPVPGQYDGRLTYCTVVDWMDETAKQKIHLLTTQVNQRGNQVIATVIGGMTRKPAASSLAQGQDIFPYALDNNRDTEDSPMRVFQNVTNSELGFLYIKGDTTQGGTLVFQDRHARPASGSPLATFSDSMVNMTPRRSRADIFNHVRNVIHPRRVDASASILFTLREPQLIPITGCLIIQGNYSDPSGGNATRAGAATTCNLTATTDYLANTASDGSGTNVTTSVGTSASFGANSFSVSASTSLTMSIVQPGAWLTAFRVRGRGMYDYEPVTLESIDANSSACYGDSVLPFDMPYQTSATVGRDAADYLLQVWAAPLTRVENVAFVGNYSNALMLAGLGREISDRITLAETATGINRDFYIQGVDFEIAPPNVFRFAWLLAPTDTYDSWILGVVGFSELGVTTRLGY